MSTGGSFLRGSAPEMGAAVLVNLPQVLFSCMYLVFNSLLTNICLSAEWNSFAEERKALRVTERRGSQRSTYFLQLPYRYALPFLTLSCGVHWLGSQSYFIVRFAVWNSGGERSAPNDVTLIAFSPLGMLLLIPPLICFLIFLVVAARRRFASGMPTASTCSAAISAACHAPAGTDETKPLMWGAIPEHSGLDGTEVVGHCSFSSDAVEKPIPGRPYL